MKEKRFQGKAGEEYNLAKLIVPHDEELQLTIAKTIKDNVPKNKEVRVIEIGCGTGKTTLAILENISEIKILAIDNEPIMIKQSKELLTKYIKDKKVVLIEADALEFLKSQPSNSFDAFTSALTLHNFSQDFRKKVLNEAYRILKVNGIFVNGDKYALNDPIEHKKTLDWQLTRIREQLSKVNRPDLVKEWTDHYIDDDHPNLLMKEKDSTKIMKELGFKEIRMVFRKQMEAIMLAKK